MRAKISQCAYVFAGMDSREGSLRNWLKDNAGQWVDIETTHLFATQYNTAEYRIYDTMIDEIEGDVRQFWGKCSYCGAMAQADSITGLFDESCVKCGNKVIPFTKENTAFLAWGGVKPQVKKIEECKIGTYSIMSFPSPSLNYYRLHNSRKTINFVYHDGAYWVTLDIGYTKHKRLDIPAPAQKKLDKYFQELYKEGK